MKPINEQITSSNGETQNGRNILFGGLLAITGFSIAALVIKNWRFIEHMIDKASGGDLPSAGLLVAGILGTGLLLGGLAWNFAQDILNDQDQIP